MVIEEVNIKNIIFFGRTGSGKSTISSMLYHEGIQKQNECPFEVNDNATGVTIDCNVKNSLNNNWKIIDTIGLYEQANGSIPHEEAIEKIKIFLKENMREGFNYICIVKKKGRIDDYDIRINDVLKQIFKKEDLQTNLFLIITNCEKEEWLNKKSRDNKTNKNEYENIYNIKKIISVDFPGLDYSEDEEDENKKNIRINNLNKLKTYLSNYNIEPVYSIVKDLKSEKEFNDIAIKILSILKYGLKKTVDALKYINDYKVEIIGGIAAIIKIITMFKNNNSNSNV